MRYNNVRVLNEKERGGDNVVLYRVQECQKRKK